MSDVPDEWIYDTLDKEPPPLGLGKDAHALWSAASKLMMDRTYGGVALGVRADLRLLARLNLANEEIDRLRGLVAAYEKLHGGLI